MPRYTPAKDAIGIKYLLHKRFSDRRESDEYQIQTNTLS